MTIHILGSGPISESLAKELGSYSAELPVFLYSDHKKITANGITTLPYENFMQTVLARQDLVLLAWRGLPVFGDQRREVLQYLARQMTSENTLWNLSSVSVYGESESINTEDQQPNPINGYGKSKYLLERYCNIFMKSKVCHFRISNVFGDPMFSDVVNRLLISAKNGSQVQLVNPKKITRDYISITTLTRILITFILEKENQISFRQVLNVASGESITLEEIRSLIESVASKPLNVIEQEVPIGVILNSDINIARLVDDFHVTIGDELRGLKDYLMKILHDDHVLHRA